MKTLALHLFDILENSVKAGASTVRLDIEGRGEWLRLRLADNGPGFPEHFLANPADPYATTRTERPVGLGLALLQQAAEETGGHLRAGNSGEGGAVVEVDVDASHLDARPVGDLAELILDTAVAWPSLALTVVLRVESTEPETVFDGEAVAEALGGIPLDRPEVRALLRRDLEEAFQPFNDWLAKVVSVSRWTF